MNITNWTPDILGNGFEQFTIYQANDYEGAVDCVLVRKRNETKTDLAILYVHGFNDYFFQKEQALEFNQHAYAFFAVDLRKYGRAHLPHQRMGNVRDLKEYFADLDACISIIKKEYSRLILLGHSTGGLIVSLYAHHHRKHLPCEAIILNSPFLDMNFRCVKKRIGLPLVSFLGRFFPNISMQSSKDDFYARTLHMKYDGEWDYNLNWKPVRTIPVNFGWTRAIHRGHRAVHKGLDIPCPILVLHSDKSFFEKKYSEEFKSGDIILNVRDIYKYAHHLGSKVTIKIIRNGMHDLVLSTGNVRKRVYEKIFSYLNENF